MAYVLHKYTGHFTNKELHTPCNVGETNLPSRERVFARALHRGIPGEQCRLFRADNTQPIRLGHRPQPARQKRVVHRILVRCTNIGYLAKYPMFTVGHATLRVGG